jgi:hypothetical protein
LVAHPPPWLKKSFEDNFKIVIARGTNTGTLKKKKKGKRKGSSPGAPNASQPRGMEMSCPGSPTLA